LAERKIFRGEGSVTESLTTLSKVARWYFSSVYGQREGPDFLLAHCDSAKVGHFAVDPSQLAEAEPPSLFKLLVALSMFQALRDVVIQRQQLAMCPSDVRVVADLDFLRQAISVHPCPALRSLEAFDQGCDVSKVGKVVDCHRLPGKPCHVKKATEIFNRMGDMGKLPTAALLRFWSGTPSAMLFEEYLTLLGTSLQHAEALVFPHEHHDSNG